jgi:hypothetical protein
LILIPRLTPWATLFRPDTSGLTFSANFWLGTPAGRTPSPGPPPDEVHRDGGPPSPISGVRWSDQIGPEIGLPQGRLCENPSLRVIPRSPPFLLADDEESCTALKILRARFLPFAPLRVGMTVWRGFSAACKAPPFRPWREIRARG